MTDAAAWVAAGISLVGAGLAYLGARQGTRPEAQAVTESQRDEWGRRFATAIELMTRPSARDRSMGRALFDALLDSTLATADDRRIAEHLVEASVLAPLPTSAQANLRPASAGSSPRAVDDIEFVEDDDTDSDAEPEGQR
jgi:uncharacterized membrane protein YcjF (UPF0283 family)